MIEMRDLKNKEYQGRICCKFQFEIPYYVFDFRRLIVNDEVSQSHDWFIMVCSIGYSSTREAEIYKYKLQYHNERPLTMVCAEVLYKFQCELKEQIQNKSNLDFYIGDLIADMKG